MFFFEPPNFSRILSPDFSSTFVGKILQEIPDEILQIDTTDIPDNFLQRGQAQKKEMGLKSFH